jgi:hypothetical protein
MTPDLTPAGALAGPAAPLTREPVAMFTRPRDLTLDEIWHGQRTTDLTRDGSQGEPLGRPGRSIEHEPVQQAERDSQHVAQSASHLVVGASVRAALRGGITS